MKISLVQIVRPSKPTMLTFALLLLSMPVIFSGCTKFDDIFKKKNQEIDSKVFTDNLVSPIGVVALPDNTKRLAIIDQIGKIWLTDEHGTKSSAPLLDVSGKLVTLNPNGDERGLLGLAFHPDFKSNRRFFVYYQLPPRPGGPQPGASWNNLSRLAEFKTMG